MVLWKAIKGNRRVSSNQNSQDSLPLIQPALYHVVHRGVQFSRKHNKVVLIAQPVTQVTTNTRKDRSHWCLTLAQRVRPEQRVERKKTCYLLKEVSQLRKIHIFSSHFHFL